MALARLMKNITWIEEGGVPVVHPPRRVPFALLSAKKPLLKDELRKLQEIEIIASITGSTPWVSSMVTVKRPNGRLRICLDPKDLNRVVKRSHYPLPMMDEILPPTDQSKSRQYLWHKKWILAHPTGWSKFKTHNLQHVFLEIQMASLAIQAVFCAGSLPKTKEKLLLSVLHSIGKNPITTFKQIFCIWTLPKHLILWTTPSSLRSLRNME